MCACVTMIISNTVHFSLVHLPVDQSAVCDGGWSPFTGAMVSLCCAGSRLFLSAHPTAPSRVIARCLSARFPVKVPASTSFGKQLQSDARPSLFGTDKKVRSRPISSDSGHFLVLAHNLNQPVAHTRAPQSISTQVAPKVLISVN